MKKRSFKIIIFIILNLATTAYAKPYDFKYVKFDLPDQYEYLDESIDKTKSVYTYRFSANQINNDNTKYLSIVIYDNIKKHPLALQTNLYRITKRFLINKTAAPFLRDTLIAFSRKSTDFTHSKETEKKYVNDNIILTSSVAGKMNGGEFKGFVNTSYINGYAVTLINIGNTFKNKESDRLAKNLVNSIEFKRNMGKKKEIPISLKDRKDRKDNKSFSECSAYYMAMAMGTRNKYFNKRSKKYFDYNEKLYGIKHSKLYLDKYMEIIVQELNGTFLEGVINIINKYDIKCNNEFNRVVSN